MGESKYFNQINKIVEDTINCTRENLPSLKISAKKCLNEINDYLNKNKDMIKQESGKEKNPCDNIFSNYFIGKLRLKYQLEITNNISNEIKIITKGKLICEFMFYIIKEVNIISLQQILKFLQDIAETVPLAGLEEIFDLMSESLKNIENFNSQISEIKLDILFLQNLFLKRINNNINDRLRGKIRLLFCDLFSISEVSGANKKGKYSKNQLNEELSNYSNDNSDTVINDEDAKMEIKEKNDEKGKDELIDKYKNNNNLNDNSKKEEKNENNKMEIEEEIKKVEKKEESKDIKEKNENIIKEEKEKSFDESDLSIGIEQNEKKKFYEQFWIIEKILINPFMVCKHLYNLYNNTIFYFIAI